MPDFEMLTWVISGVAAVWPVALIVFAILDL